jgi:hypothetical protein
MTSKQASTLVIGRWISLLVITILTLTIVHGQNSGLSLGELTKDINATMGTSPFLGFLSQLGIFIWAATASICLLTATFLSPKRGGYRFLLCSGLLSLWLGFDDVFMLHEMVFPRAGINEQVILATYIGLVSGLFLAYKRLVVQTDYLLLGITALCFGASLGIDYFDFTSDVMIFLEDSFKFAGTMFWLGYYLSVVKRYWDGQQRKRNI